MKPQLKLEDNLIITCLDEEGLVFEVDTRRSFWVNEAGAFLLKLIETNHGRITLKFARKLLRQKYITNDGSKMEGDLGVFVSSLKRFRLASLQPTPDGSDPINFNVGPGKSYVKPIIKEETNILPVTGAVVRAARMAVARSAAVSRALAAGFRSRFRGNDERGGGNDALFLFSLPI